MEELLIQPDFIDAQSPQLLFPEANLNALVENEYGYTFGFWQAMFGIFSYMKVTKKGKFTVHDVRGTPLVWQPLKSCVSDATGALRMNKREIVPCEAVLKEKMCWDELLGSLFEHFLSFEGDVIDLDQNGARLFNQALTTLMQNASLGARMTLTSGNLYNVDESAITYDSEASLDEVKLFKATYSTCDGWMKRLSDLQAGGGADHLNIPNFFDTRVDGGTNDYNGNFVNDYDTMKGTAKAKMRKLINAGGFVTASGRQVSALVLVSDDVYSGVVTRYNTESALAAQNERRLTREAITVGAGARPRLVYYIDQNPIIPLSEIGGFDQWLTGQTHFMGITMAGNIQLGSSFDSIPGTNGQDVGMLIEQSRQVKDYGTFYYLAHALFANAIVDTDYFVGAQAYSQ